MQKNNRHTYVCTKLFLYYFLTDKGFVPYRVAPDKRDCHKLVWLYDDSKEIRDAVDEYYAMDYDDIVSMYNM